MTGVIIGVCLLAYVSWIVYEALTAPTIQDDEDKNK